MDGSSWSTNGMTEWIRNSPIAAMLGILAMAVSFCGCGRDEERILKPVSVATPRTSLTEIQPRQAAIQLLEEAVESVSAISQPWARATGLSRIAAGYRPWDEARTSALIDEAESLLLQTKREPANHEEDVLLRFTARSAVASALLDEDLDRSEFILALAVSDAAGYLETPEHGPAVCALAPLVARCRGLPEAMAFVDSVVDPWERDRAALAVVVFEDVPGLVWFINNPNMRAAAEVYLLVGTPGRDQQRILETAPTFILELLKAGEYDLVQTTALLCALMSYQYDPAQTLDLLEISAKVAEDKMEDEAAVIVGGMAIAIQNSDPDEARALFQRAEAIARRQEEPGRTYSLLHIANGIRRLDASKATSLFQEAEKQFTASRFAEHYSATMPIVLTEAAAFFVRDDGNDLKHLVKKAVPGK